MKKREPCFRLTTVISVLAIIMLTLSSCASTKVKIYPKETQKDKPSQERVATVKPSPRETYAETISGWKSYQDLVKWMGREFSFDSERYKNFVGRTPIPRTPEETFQLKSGIYIDATEFSKKTLNRINPSYKAQTVVIIVRPNVFNHYVCSFEKEGQLFIIDYGTPYKEITGVHGPYHSLEEYKKFYEKRHPEKRHVEGISRLP